MKLNPNTYTILDDKTFNVGDYYLTPYGDVFKIELESEAHCLNIGALTNCKKVKLNK